jgi:hypothetical protein
MNNFATPLNIKSSFRPRPVLISLNKVKNRKLTYKNRIRIKKIERL